MLVEHARNLLGIDAASHAEYGDGGVAVVSLLTCSLAESEIEISITPGTRLAAIHPGERRRVERTHCNYGLSPDFAHIASAAGMKIGAVDDTGEVRAVERPDHPFFIGHAVPAAAHVLSPRSRIRSGWRSSPPSPADPITSGSPGGGTARRRTARPGSLISLVHQSASTFPVRRPQVLLQDLAARVAGQGVDPVDRRGALELRQTLTAVVDDLPFRRLGAGAYGRSAPSVSRPTDREGTPITAASATAGCAISTFSISAG